MHGSEVAKKRRDEREYFRRARHNLGVAALLLKQDRNDIYNVYMAADSLQLSVALGIGGCLVRSGLSVESNDLKNLRELIRQASAHSACHMTEWMREHVGLLVSWKKCREYDYQEYAYNEDLKYADVERAMLEIRRFFERNGIVMSMEKQIHSLKRRIVYEIVEMAKKHTCIQKIVVFGSAITDRCTEHSDIDLWIDCSINCYDSQGVFVPEVDEIISEIDAITNYNADILFNEQLVGSYVEDSARNGVCVYDKDEEVRSAAL